MKALFYDRDLINGVERLYKLVDAIQSAAPKELGLQIEACGRPKQFGSEKGAEDLLLQSPFPYKAVIINTSAVDSERVIEAARYGLECDGMAPDRIICIYPKGFEPVDTAGTRAVLSQGGNGYLLPADAREVVDILRELKTFSD